MPNWIFARLCDNDFGRLLLAAVEYVEHNREVDLTEAEFKLWVVDHMVYGSALRRINPSMRPSREDLDHTRAYLDRHLEITYPSHQPVIDHDWGSVIMDVNLGRAWMT